MRYSVPSARYSSVCNVLRQWSISLIPTYDIFKKTFLEKMKCDAGLMIDLDIAEKRYGNKVGMSN